MQRSRTTLEWKPNARVLLLVVPVLIVVAVAAIVVLRAQRILNRARESAPTASHLGYSLKPLQQASATTAFEPVASSPSFRSGVFLDGKLYLIGPAGLTIAGEDGSPRRTLRTGIELPVAQTAAIAIGRLRGASEPQVLVATRGAGVLMLQPGSAGVPTIQQLLPADPGLRDVTAVLALATGDLLLGTRDRGLLLYNGGSLSRIDFAVDGVNSSTLQVTALAAAEASSYLVGTRNDGVFYAHAGMVQHASSDSGLPDADVEAIVLADRRAYVGTPLGTAAFDLSAQAFRPARILAEGEFTHSLGMQKDQLLVGTLDRGIKTIPFEQRAGLRRASISMGAPAYAAGERIDGFVSAPDVLYALADGVLTRRSGASWISALPADPDRLADRNVSALAFAPDGSLYVGFFDHGLDILSPDGSRIRHQEDDHLFCINRLALDPMRHTMAAATANGLVLFDEQGAPRQTLLRRDGLISDHITDIAFGAGGTALATPAGITFLTPSGAESLYAFQGLVNNHVYALASGPQDQLLAGTLGGLSLLHARKVQHSFTVSNSGLKHNWVTALLPTDKGGYLVGTYGAGLESLGPSGDFVPVELPSGVSHDVVINPNALFATPTHVYAGTLGEGMLAYSMATGRWASVTGGLPSLNVTAFAARGGELYIGTENGLVRVAEASLP